MVGVSAIGICEEIENTGNLPELNIYPDFTDLERMMLDAIMTECSQCIITEGSDCMLKDKGTSCPFVDVRRTCGILDIQERK